MNPICFNRKYSFTIGDLSNISTTQVYSTSTYLCFLCFPILDLAYLTSVKQTIRRGIKYVKTLVSCEYIWTIKRKEIIISGTKGYSNRKPSPCGDEFRTVPCSWFKASVEQAVSCTKWTYPSKIQALSKKTPSTAAMYIGCKTLFPTNHDYMRPINY